jgi:hypothetical protein
MKPNLKINQGILAISILHLILVVIATIRRLNHFGFGSNLNFWLDIFSDLTFLIPLIYIVVLLKLVGEKKYVVYYFTSFIVIIGLNSILFYTPQFYSSNYISVIVGIVTSFLILGVIAICFNIRNPILRFPFRVLAIAYILLLIVNWGIPVILPLLMEYYDYFRVAKYLSYSRVLPGLGLAYIIYRSEILFKTPELG